MQFILFTLHFPAKLQEMQETMKGLLEKARRRRGFAFVYYKVKTYSEQSIPLTDRPEGGTMPASSLVKAFTAGNGRLPGVPGGIIRTVGL